MNNTQNAHSLNKYFQRKDNDFKAQLKKVYDAFFEQPRTMLEVAEKTNVMRSNICWYVREWRQNSQIVALKKRKCSISGYPYVYELTTNPRLFDEVDKDQLSLF
jgi:predicted transcriptional regulator